MSRRPLILITLCRRYHELSICLEHIWKAYEAGEFDERPEIWVVWARPELQRLWYLQELKAQGRITRLLTRPGDSDEQEGQATTVPESRNLRLGLEVVRETYGDAVYVIGMTADIQTRPGVFRHLDRLVNIEHHTAVVFHWQNGALPFGVWHTNFFVVPTLEDYWPPMAQSNSQDVLERQWGLKLEATKPTGLCKTNNCGFKFFTHHHLSETLPPWPYRSQMLTGTCSLVICGKKYWWQRFLDWCISLSTVFKFIRREHG